MGIVPLKTWGISTAASIEAATTMENTPCLNHENLTILNLKTNNFGNDFRSGFRFQLSEKTPGASFQLLSHQSRPETETQLLDQSNKDHKHEANVGKYTKHWVSGIGFIFLPYTKGLSSFRNNKNSEFNVKATFAELLGFQESLILKGPRMEVAQIHNVWRIYLLLGNLRVNVDKYTIYWSAWVCVPPNQFNKDVGLKNHDVWKK